MDNPFAELISDAMLRQRALEYAIQALNNAGCAAAADEYVRYGAVFLEFLQPNPPVPQPLERAA